LNQKYHMQLDVQYDLHDEKNYETLSSKVFINPSLMISIPEISISTCL
jgi:hypothetical protein